MTDQDRSKLFSVLITGLLVLAISFMSVPGALGDTGDYDGDLILSIHVHDGDVSVEDATVEVLNSSNIVNSGLTDSDGQIELTIDQDITDGSIKVKHDDYDTKTIDYNCSLPTNSTQTTVESVSVNLGTDYSQEADDFYQENEVLVLAGGGIFIILILAMVGKYGSKKGW